MSDLDSGDFIDLRTVADLENTTVKEVTDRCTIGRGGVRLESILIGPRRYTTGAALQTYEARVKAAGAKPRQLHLGFMDEEAAETERPERHRPLVRNQRTKEVSSLPQPKRRRGERRRRRTRRNGGGGG